MQIIGSLYQNYSEFGIARGVTDRPVQIFNCYSIGNNKIGDSRATIKNSYAISEQGIKYYSLNGTETTEEKSNLLTLLNDNRENGETWSEWTVDSEINSGYPVFVWQTENE